MATYKDVMRWVAELDVTDAIKGFGKLESEGKKSLNSVADETDEVEGKFSGLPDKFKGVGGKIGTALSGGFAALGVGALMVSALEKSWEKAGGLRKITGQFRLSADEVTEYSKTAGDLYAENWGDSIQDVQQVVATAGQRLEDTTGDSLAAISEQILAVSDTWGEDYQSVIRSVTQLTDNGLAPSSQAALDLIVTGFQDGGNEAGDLLDTIDEYAQHWSAMGLSGEDALNQVIHGFQNGQRDADKMADAVKEMRIRIVENADPVREALEDIGVNANEVVDALLEGGPAAREAFLEVVGALKRGQDAGDDTSNAVAIIGTQFEDLGPKALESLLAVEGQLRETQGAAQDLADTVGEVSPWQDAQREAESLLGKVGDGLALQIGPSLKNVNDGIDGLSDGFGLFGEEAVEATTQTTKAMDLVAESIENAKNEFNELSGDTTTAMSAVEDSIAAAKDEFDRASDRARRFGSDGVENMGRVEQAADETGDEIQTLRDRFADLLGTMSDREKYLGAQDGFDSVQAAAEAAYTAAAEGSAEAEGAARDHERAVINLKENVIDYADEVGNIPDEVVSDILALIDEGSLAEAERKLAHLERVRNATINVTTNFRPTQAPQYGGQFHDGGVVPGPIGAERMILAKGGETVLPTHKPDGGGVASGSIELGDDTIRKLANLVVTAMNVGAARSEAQLLAELRGGVR